jgi:KipI family sensor histidine kinase inhibitor
LEFLSGHRGGCSTDANTISMTLGPRIDALKTTHTFEPLAEDVWLIHIGTTDGGSTYGGSAQPSSAHHDSAAAGIALDASRNACVHALAAAIRAASPPWLRDLTPAYASLGVHFDDTRSDAEQVRAWLQALCQQPHTADAAAAARVVEIPVRYGGEYGQDFDALAQVLGLTPERLIALHTAPVYTVAMIGFAPGFPYLSGLDPALAQPRLTTPRTRVPAGSVGIGGAQTGVYPRESPGGWRLIGRTPLTLFDPRRGPPSLLMAGDRVRLVAIDDAQFARLAAGV